VGQAEDPRQGGEAVQLAPALLADAPAGVERQPEDDHQPSGDDAHRGPHRHVGADEGDRDVGEAGVQEAVAEQGHRVDDERDDRRQRERLVRDAQVGPAPLQQLAAHRQADRHGHAREQQRERARRTAGDPEEVLADHQDWLVVTLEPELWVEDEPLVLEPLEPLELEPPEPLVLEPLDPLELDPLDPEEPLVLDPLESLEPLVPDPLVPEPLVLDPLDDESSEDVVPLDVSSEDVFVLDASSEDPVVVDAVVLVSLFACCDALLVDVLPR
jgi:hypothetical protein